MTRNDHDNVFQCEVSKSDSIELNAENSETRLEFCWVGSVGNNVYLGRAACGQLIKQLQSFIDSGCLLSKPEPDANAKATAKSLLGAVGLEVDLDQIRVIQETEEVVE